MVLDRLRVKISECKCKENYGRLKEQFINGINGEVMTAEIVKEMTVMKHTRKITSEQVISWPK